MSTTILEVVPITVNEMAFPVESDENNFTVNDIAAEDALEVPQEIARKTTSVELYLAGSDEEKKAMYLKRLIKKTESVQNELQDPCLIWRGAKHLVISTAASEKKHYYGVVSINGVNSLQVHRVSYILNVGAIPDGLIIRHKCTNKLCIERSHLEPGTNQDNSNDRIRDGTQPIGSKNPMATIADENTAQQIKDSWVFTRGRKQRGESLRERAQKFNVSVNVVKKIDYGHAWGHLPRRGEVDAEAIKHKERRNHKRKLTRKEFAEVGIPRAEYEAAWIRMQDLWQELVTNNNGPNQTKISTPDSPCYLLRADPDTYAYITIRDLKFKAHIISWEFNKNNCRRQRDRTKVVSHKCNVNNCCNDEHLELATFEDNSAEIKAAGRQNHPIKYSNQQVQDALLKLEDRTKTKTQVSKETGIKPSMLSALSNGNSRPELQPNDTSKKRKRGERVDYLPDEKVHELRDLKEQNPDLTNKEIAVRTGQHRKTVGRQLTGATRAAAGGPLQAPRTTNGTPGKQFDDEKKQQIFQLLSEKNRKTNRQIAKIVGCSESSMTNYVKLYEAETGVKLKSAKEKLSFETAQIIRARCADGATDAALAKEYGVNVKNIGKIRRNLIYEADGDGKPVKSKRQKVNSK